MKENTFPRVYGVRFHEADWRLLERLTQESGHNRADEIRLALRERAERRATDFMGRLRMVRSA